MPLLSTFGAASGRSFGGIGAAAAGEVLDIDDVFSTYLVTGTGSAYTVNNGIDLSGEGGLVWIKGRNLSGYNHTLYDTERSGTLFSDTTNAASDYASEIASYNNNGFTTVSSGAAYNNVSGTEYASWTFRKAKKFFDVVTYSGTGSAQNINHSLGQSPGMIMIKSTSNAENWQVWHRSVTGNLELDNAGAINSSSIRITAVSSTNFTLGTFNTSNGSGQTYVAYLFAHNNNDGGFGPDSDQDVIKCGSYTGNGSATGPTVNLGFEPQIIMYKNTSGTGNWQLHDVMRGIPTGSNDAIVYANKNWAENSTNDWLDVNATGFQIKSSGSDANTNGETYIYMAIRRGPLVEPTSASDVFAIDTFGSTGDGKNPGWRSGFPVDMALYKVVNGSSDGKIASRLTGDKYLRTNETNTESTDASFTFDYNNGWYDYTGTISSYYSWMWKRAPSYFDVVAYTGDGSAGHTVSHNLGVAPEMMWVKARTLTYDWHVQHKDIQANQVLNLNSTASVSGGFWNTTRPTSTVFTLGSDFETNRSGYDFIAYLFATVAGVSKVGSFSHTSGQTQNIDCGFSSGARFVLVKQYGSTGAWFLYDTTRGIVAGNDPRIKLDDTSAQNTSNDDIDPLSSGFTLTTNFSGGDYIFYAIA